MRVQLDMDSKLDVKRQLNVFNLDSNFEQSEAEWAATRAELLGESDGDDEDGESDGGDKDGTGESDSDAEAAAPQAVMTQVRSPAPACLPHRCRAHIA
jgi:hypothetical protein